MTTRPMLLALDSVRRIAAEVARAHGEAIDVIAALTQAGGSGYTELLITLRGETAGPRLVSVGMDRQSSEREFRAVLTQKLRAHLGRSLSRSLPGPR